MLRIAMTVSAALFLAGSSAIAAQSGRELSGFSVRAIPLGQAGAPLTPQPPGLYPLSAQFGNLPPKDGDGNDYWPCYTDYTDADCSSLPGGGVVVGIPVYAWSLSACDNNSPPANPCGQLYFFYQDLTGDQTDHMILTVTVRQGSNYIFAKGPVDLGPDPYLNEVVVFSGDKAFGTQGQTGKGNGWCAGSKKTCVEPVAGPATGEALIQVGPYQLKQKFTIYLQ